MSTTTQHQALRGGGGGLHIFPYSSRMLQSHEPLWSEKQRGLFRADAAPLAGGAEAPRRALQKLTASHGC